MFSADLGVNQVASTPAATDPPFQKVALLLHGDGTNGSQNNTFVDSSTNNFTITRYGNTTQGTFTPFSQAAEYWSNYIPSAGSTYLSPGSSTSLALGSGDFTVELFVYVNAMGSYSTFLDWRSGGSYPANIPLLIDWNNNGKLCFIYGTGSSFVTVIESSITITLKQWVHIAVVRSGTTVTMYFNGASVGSGTDSTNFGIQNLSIANQQATNFNADAYFSNVRLVKGTAVYTAAFTPPTAPLTAITNTSLLTCQSNRFIDNSSNNFTITPAGDVKVTAFSPFAPSAAYSASTNGGSAYFDGNGDQLRTSGTGLNDFGTGDFTIEGFVYITPGATSYSGYGRTYFLCPNPIETYGANNLGININGSTIGAGGIQVIYNSSNLINYTTAIPQGVWNHIAVTRSSGTMYLFINGVSVASVSSTQSFTNVPISVGGLVSTNQIYNDYLNGYASNFRIVNGTAVYTSNFTPPTAPLTAVTNTSLLLNCTNAGIIDNAGKNDIETVGNAQISTSVKKYGTGSMYFDGTGDWLYLADRPELQLGTGNFTIEGWLYLGATGTARGIVGKGTSTTGWLLSTNSSNQVVFTYGSSTITSTGTLSGSTWYHIAVCRVGTGTNQTKIYIDGSNDGTGTVSTNFNQTNVMYVGADRTGGSAMNGYIDDLRITLGQALYTSNFTPPTQAFPNV